MKRTEITIFSIASHLLIFTACESLVSSIICPLRTSLKFLDTQHFLTSKILSNFFVQSIFSCLSWARRCAHNRSMLIAAYNLTEVCWAFLSTSLLRNHIFIPLTNPIQWRTQCHFIHSAIQYRISRKCMCWILGSFNNIGLLRFIWSTQRHAISNYIFD